MERAVDVQRVPARPLVPEADSLVHPPGRLVEVVDLELDPLEPELVEPNVSNVRRASDPYPWPVSAGSPIAIPRPALPFR
jgi:hypothetical protein